MSRTGAGRRGNASAQLQSRQGQPKHVSQIYNRTLEQCSRTQAAFERLRQAETHRQPNGPERDEFLSHLRAFHELNLELHETLEGAESGDRRAMHDAFSLAREAYLKAQSALTRVRQARDRGEDDGPDRATFLAEVRAYDRLSRAAHELAIKVEPSCQEGSLVQINEALRDWHEAHEA